VSIVYDTDGALGAAELVKVVTRRARVGSILELPDHGVQVQLLAEEGIETSRVSEELSHHEQVRILRPGGLKKILTDVNRSRVGVVKSEAISNLGH
jgi:hypothetical protein